MDIDGFWCELYYRRSEWRGGGEGGRRGGSPEVKNKTSRRSSCSPFRRRRRSPSPGGAAKESNGHNVLKGILKTTVEGSQGNGFHGGMNKRKLELESGLLVRNSQFRSKTAGRQWGKVNHQDEDQSRRRSRQSSSPYQNSRKGLGHERYTTWFWFNWNLELLKMILGGRDVTTAIYRHLM